MIDDIKYLNGFECDEFFIVNGHYSGYKGEIKKIGCITKIRGWDSISIDDNYGCVITVLDYLISSDEKIIKDMMSYYKYNKRKQIIESL